MSILSGPVVFIDDQIDLENSQAAQLLKEIRSTGRPVASSKVLPDDPRAWMQHWQSLAFAVIDWDLSPGSGGGTGASELGDFARESLFGFVKLLMQEVFCPIFIISAEATSDIERQLGENVWMRTQTGQLDPRVSVFSKDVLMGKLVDHLEQQVANSPSLSALRAWEGGFDLAKNRLFNDLNQMEPDWATYVWEAAEEDSVDASYELATVISANLLGRFDPVVFDGNSIRSGAKKTNAAARRVLQGRTFVQSSQLPDTMVMPGDFFRLGKNDDEIWINVSPACQTVGRSGEPIQLLLLKGTRLAKPASESAFKDQEHKHRGPNKIMIHTLLDEHPYAFEFGKAQFQEWDKVRGARIGRLLPPYVTRLQQMHAAFIQSEGVPHVNASLYLGDS